MDYMMVVILSSINPYKPSVLFVGHWQTVQNQKKLILKKKKNQQTTEEHAQLPSRPRVK